MVPPDAVFTNTGCVVTHYRVHLNVDQWVNCEGFLVRIPEDFAITAPNSLWVDHACRFVGQRSLCNLIEFGLGR